VGDVELYIYSLMMILELMNNF